MSTFFSAETLERAWLKAMREILVSGDLIKEDKPFREVRNLKISYSNAFETESLEYLETFGTEFLDYIHRVYSPEGDPATGRNYYNLIYAKAGINQVDKIIAKLREEPLTRSATIILASLGAEKQPCVTEVNFSIRGNLLHMSAIFKSSDLARKFIPDMLELSAVHAEISRKLHISRGHSSAFILSAQLYEENVHSIEALMLRLKRRSYFKTDAIRENWDKEAEAWDVNIEDPSHYVNIEDGYSRFLDFLRTEIHNSTESGTLALDSGCGTGVIADQLNVMGYETVAIDISPKMLEFAHKDPTSRDYVLANSLDIPYSDEDFSLIVTRGVLVSHVGKQYVQAFIKEHARVLKVGGKLMFDFITHFEENEARERRTKAYLSYRKVKALLEANGFVILARSGKDSNRVNAILCEKRN